DRKSTRLNSSHVSNSYAVFCSKKKNYDDEKEIDSSSVSVDSETEAEGSSQTPEERLERIAAEHDVPEDLDPKEAQAAGEGAASSSSTDDERDVRGGDTKEDEDTSSEPPD